MAESGTMTEKQLLSIEKQRFFMRQLVIYVKSIATRPAAERGHQAHWKNIRNLLRFIDKADRQADKADRQARREDR